MSSCRSTNAKRRLLLSWLTIGAARAVVENWCDGEISAGDAKRRLVAALRMDRMPDDDGEGIVGVRTSAGLVRLPGGGER